MNGSHFDKETQRERTCSLVHGTWHCVGAKIACAGACALMVGQLLLPSVALATEYADPAAATGEVAAAPVTPTVAEDTAAPAPVPVAPAAPMADAAPVAQSKAEPQQAQQDASVATANDATPVEQNTPSVNAATPANDAIMPCGVTDVVGGSGVRVNITVRNNYTDIKKEETIEYVKGIALVDGDQSALDGSALTFIGLGDLIVHAAYDSASNKTTLTLDISKIQRQKEEQKYFTEYKENKSKMTTTYDGSKLTYTGTEPGNIIIGDPDDAFKGDTEATGKPTINEIRDDYYTRTHVYERACLVIPAAESESESISFANVQNTNFNWQLDTGPQATAGVPNYDADKYEIAYECWQEFENNEPVAAWYSDNGSHGSLPTITKFKSGKEYVYSLMLKPKDGYSFSDETVVTVNGETVKSSLSGEFLYVPAIKTITMPASSENEALHNLDVNDVKTDYAPGEAPRAAATIPAVDADKYEIAYECWEEMELDMESGESVPVAFWYSDPAKYTPGMKKIDHFEEGKFYMCSVELRLKGDNTVADDCNMNVNGHWAHHIKTVNGVFAPNADNMLCEQPIDEWRAIDVIEIDGATTTFKAGDKPVFTANVPTGSNSLPQCEYWTGSDGSEVNSVEFWDQHITNHIDAFKPGVTYRYGIYLKPARGFYFTPDTKLVINGQECGYRVADSVSDEDSGWIYTLWLNTDLTFTPEATPTPGPQPTPDPKPTPQPEVKPAAKPEVKPAAKPATTAATIKTVEKTTQAKKGDAVLATTGDTTAMTVAALGIAGATVAAAGLAATKRRKR